MIRNLKEITGNHHKTQETYGLLLVIIVLRTNTNRAGRVAEVRSLTLALEKCEP
jgi:hypothetical protein